MVEPDDDTDFETARKVAFRAQRKLEDAEAALEQMRQATDAGEYERAFEACLSAIQTAGYRLEQDVKNVARGPRKHLRKAAEDWWREIESDVRSDELLDWMEQARHAGIPVGASKLHFTYRLVGAYHTDDYLPAPEPGPTSFAISQTGVAYWVYDGGTPYERRITARLRPGSPTYEHHRQGGNLQPATLADPPTQHLGAPIGPSPIDACHRTIDWWRSVAGEAVRLWAAALK